MFRNVNERASQPANYTFMTLGHSNQVVYIGDGYTKSWQVIKMQSVIYFTNVVTNVIYYYYLYVKS